VVATALFGLALLTKTVTATLPAALLVVGWWQRGRLDWRKDVAPLLPWFALGAGFGLVTAHFERTLIGADGADFALSAVQRSLLAGRVLWFYLGQLAWPAKLIFIYPRWTIDAAQAWQWLFPIAALLAFGALLWWQRRQRGPLAAGLLFAGALFPVLGFVNVYPFIFSYVADHFQYLATLPVFALAGAGLTRLAVRLPGWVGAVAAMALLGGLGTLTWDQTGMYRDSTTLFETTLDRNPDCWMAHHNLAVILAGEGRFAEALSHQEAAVRLYPDYAPAENNLGDDLLQLNRVAEALPHLERAVRLHPAYAVAHCNLGLALARLDRTDDALSHFAEAVRLQPAYAEAELNWGLGLMLTGHFPEALPHFQQALRLNPNSVDAHHTFGRALASQGRYAEAIVQFRETLRLAPEYGDAHLNLAQALRQIGQDQESREHEREAERLRAAR
jgi:protein O-mannosyl-transferase